jgi:hypothetical protein
MELRTGLSDRRYRQPERRNCRKERFCCGMTRTIAGPDCFRFRKNPATGALEKDNFNMRGL